MEIAMDTLQAHSPEVPVDGGPYPAWLALRPAELASLLRLAPLGRPNVSSLATALERDDPVDVASACEQLIAELRTARALVRFDAAHRLAALRTLQGLCQRLQGGLQACQ